MKFPTKFWAIFTILMVLIADQALKIWIKTNMMLHASIYVTDWFQLLFIENNGMAFGMEVMGKSVLTLFRIVASGAIIYYMYLLVKKNFKTGYIICVALIFAGAVGNIIDSVFYGVIFSDSYGQVATLFPPEGGYASLQSFNGWFHGKVVDMFYFPLIETTWPSWVPYWGGSEFIFFRPVFNLADSAITVGVAILLLFYRKSFSQSFDIIKN